MAYVTPTVVASGDVATAAAWNVVVGDIVAGPRGVLGKATLTTAFTTSATHTTYQDTGLSASVAYENGRILRVSCQSHYYPSGGLQAIGIRLVRGTTTIAQFEIGSAALATTAVTTNYVECFITTASATTETFKVQIAAGSANTAVQQYAGSPFDRFLIVEDIGAA